MFYRVMHPKKLHFFKTENKKKEYRKNKLPPFWVSYHNRITWILAMLSIPWEGRKIGKELREYIKFIAN